MGVPDLTYHTVPLPTLGVELPAAFAPDAQRLYFPVATVCAALELDLKYHRGKVQREYKEFTERLRLPTAGGPQELLCIEWTALGLWLATIQGERTTSDTTRTRLRIFRSQVMAAASAILLGQAEAIALVEPRGRRRGATDLIETRLAQLERAVFVGEPAGEDDERIAACPHCGRPIRVSRVYLEAVSDSGDEE